jgi:hypothetical protein
MYDEHIEATVASFREVGLALDPHDVAMAVLDTAFAQGLVIEDELDLAAATIAGQVERLLASEVRR